VVNNEVLKTTIPSPVSFIPKKESLNMSLRIVQGDAFTATPFAGNPAAVCVLPEPREDHWMQEVARDQIALSFRVFVVECTDRETGKHSKVAMANPEIIKAEGEQRGVDGCLSIPGYDGVNVRRAPHIVVKGQDMCGKPMRVSAEGLFAWALQHEIDYLDGILYRCLTRTMPMITRKRHKDSVVWRHPFTTWMGGFRQPSVCVFPPIAFIHRRVITPRSSSKQRKVFLRNLGTERTRQRKRAYTDNKESKDGAVDFSTYASA
jgi:peptide deformylase